jgi:hypothetical protein
MRDIFCFRRDLTLFVLSIILGFLLGTYTWAATDTTFEGKVQVSTSWVHSQTGKLTTVSESLGTLLSQTHTTGTNAAQMNAFVTLSGTLTNTQTRTINLNATTNTFGQAVNFWRVNHFSAQSPAGTFGSLTISGGSLPDATIQPAGMVLFSAPGLAGYTVTNATLTISNPGPSNATYQVVIGGAQ